MQSASDQFLAQLSETIAWCEPRVDTANPKYCLRSDQLRPKVELGSDPRWDVDIWVEAPMVEYVVKKRAEILSPVRLNRYTREDGRLLLHFLDYSNHNGLTAGITSYYLDHNDTPPWDTWIQALPTHNRSAAFLVSWVPKPFIDIVQEATECECLGMLMWAEDSWRWDGGGEVPEWLVRIARGEN